MRPRELVHLSAQAQRAMSRPPDFADEEELGIVVDKMVNTNKDKDTPEELTINQNDDIPRDI